MTDPIGPVELRTPALTARGLLLRPWRTADAADVARICGDPDVARWTQVPSPYGAGDAEAWIAGQPAAWAEGRNATWAITDAAAGRILGSIGLDHLDREFPEVGYWTAPEARGRGVTVAAVRAACRWALDRGAPKVLWLAQVGNEASWRVAHRAGFTYEGRRPAECGLRDGSRVDAWAASLLPGVLDRARPGFPYDPRPPLVDGAVSLRRWRTDDASAWAALRSEPSVAGWGGDGPPEGSEVAARERICGAFVEHWLLGASARLAVCLDGEPVGGVSLRTPNPGVGEMGWWLGPAARGRGVGTRAVRLVAAWGFGQLGLRRISAGIHVENAPSRALAARVGFVAEGVRRQGAPAFGPGWGDALAHGLLPADLHRPVS